VQSIGYETPIAPQTWGGLIGTYCDICPTSDAEGANAILPTNQLCRLDRTCRDDFGQRHAKHQALRQHRWHVVGRTIDTGNVEVRGERVAEETCARGSFCHIPNETALTVPKAELDPACTRI
jgi:hypothetical protein